MVVLVSLYYEGKWVATQNMLWRCGRTLNRLFQQGKTVHNLPPGGRWHGVAVTEGARRAVIVMHIGRTLNRLPWRNESRFYAHIRFATEVVIFAPAEQK